jgi:ribosomal-protein-alanine N-acetyltransferase
MLESFLEVGGAPPEGPVLECGPVRLRPPQADDYFVWARLREESRAHLIQWEQDWTPEEASHQGFRLRLKAYAREMRRGGALPLFIFAKGGRKGAETLVGGVTLSNIRYGAACAATLGYWIGACHLRNGYGRAAVRGILEHAFGALGLHRVEAACQPRNLASIGLLRSSGFEEEGFAKAYLRINGAWRDHLLFARRAAA